MINIAGQKRHGIQALVGQAMLCGFTECAAIQYLGQSIQVAFSAQLTDCVPDGDCTDQDREEQGKNKILISVVSQ